MSKAFTKDDDPGEVVLGRVVSRGGEPRPITKGGWDALVVKLAAIEEDLATLESGSQRRQARAHERELCAATMSEVRIVEPPAHPTTVVFGCTVVVRGEHGDRTLTLVGPDETNPKTGRISISSPVAQRLLGSAVGDEVDLPKQGPSSIVSIQGHPLPP